VSKRLYNVLITFDVLVLADDADEARDVDMNDVRDAAEPTVIASEATYMPSGWGAESLPLGDDDDGLTIDKWIEAGAAPLLKAQMERRAKLAGKVSP
jgi:hypothetical protein